MSKKKHAPRPHKPVCPRCKHAGYTQDVAFDGRPRFTCGGCQHTWTAGHSGGEWTKKP